MSETGEPEVNFSIYIYKVLKQVHPDTGITSEAKAQVNSLLNVVAEAISSKAAFICHKDKKKTLSSRIVQVAVRLVLPRELTKHAVSEGVKAVTKFVSSEARDRGRPPITRQARAGLQFPPVRAERFLRNAHCTGREYNGGLRGAIGSGSSVYLAAVLEYLAAEILELAGNCARDQRRTRITPRCLYIAMQNDYELTNLVKRVKWQVYRGGVVPNIHAALLPERR